MATTIVLRSVKLAKTEALGDLFLTWTLVTSTDDPVLGNGKPSLQNAPHFKSHD